MSLCVYVSVLKRLGLSLGKVLHSLVRFPFIGDKKMGKLKLEFSFLKREKEFMFFDIKREK